jgi:hypothetical protein
VGLRRNSATARGLTGGGGAAAEAAFWRRPQVEARRAEREEAWAERRRERWLDEHGD